jgi:hypothetical protein
MRKILSISLLVLPIVAMIGLIPLVQTDVTLAIIYMVFSFALLLFRPERNDLVAYGIGLIGITLSELLFVSTGVETFTRQSLFGLIPLWLPLLWAYAFVTIKRGLRIIEA